MKAAEWIDQVKQRHGWESDYRVAKELELGRATVSKYRSGATPTFDDETAAKVATALDIQPEIIVLDQVAERTRVDSVRAGVTRVLEGLMGKKSRAAVRAGGGKAPVDISSAVYAATTDGGDPASGRPGITIVSV